MAVGHSLPPFAMTFWSIGRSSLRIIDGQRRLGGLTAYGDDVGPPKKRSLDLSGIFPAVVTPFEDDRSSVSFRLLHENFSRWASIPFKGYLVQGSNGEFAAMDPDERVRMVASAKGYLAQNQPGKLLLAGSGCQSTKQTVEMCVRMAEAGADALLVITPSFYKGRLTDGAFLEYYSEVADRSPAPVVLYSVPANTAVDLDAKVIERLARHPNIVALKDSGGDMAKLSYLAKRTERFGFQVLAGSAGFLLAALSVGCVGGITALANVLGHDVCRLHEAHLRGDLEEARSLQARLVGPNWAVTKTFGVAGLKYSMRLLGLDGGQPRKPLALLDEREREALEKVFRDEAFL